MFQNPYVLLAVGALGLVGCVLLLYFGVQMLREERAAKDKAQADAPPAEPSTAAPESGEAVAAAPPAAAPAPRPALARPGGTRSKGSAHEVLRVLRDNLTGRLVIEIAGRRYASLDELQDSTLADGLLTTLNDLQVFTGGAVTPTGLGQVTEPSAPRALKTATTDLPPANPKAAPAAVPAATSSMPKPLPAPTMNPFKQMQVLREMAKNPPPEPKSITEQIDEVLQARIAGTPLAERKLKMRTGPRGEAQFDLDGESYPSVDEVPDMEVREALKAAISAWERTQ